MNNCASRIVNDLNDIRFYEINTGAGMEKLVKLRMRTGNERELGSGL
jgi:hypothetical protein